MSNLSVSIIVTAINTSFAAQRATNDAKLERFSAELKLLNEGIAPTVDCNGRLHAPLNGYQCEGGHVFTKGQFIPVTYDEYDDSTRLKVRIKGEAFISAIRASGEPLATNVGASWVGVDGTECANLYIEVARGEEKIVEDAIEAVQASYGVTIIEHAQDGKQAVTGEILGFWSKQSEYGVQEGFTVRLADGSVYKGTLPKTAYDGKTGDSITFTANFIKGSPYFKRPSKAKINKQAMSA